MALAVVAVRSVMGLEEKMIRLMRDIRFYRHFGERNSRHRLERGERDRQRCCGQCHKCGISTEEESEIIFGHVVFKTITERLKKKRWDTQVRV